MDINRPNVRVIFLLVGTNDFSSLENSRNNFPISHIISDLLTITDLLIRRGKVVNIIKPPPKSDTEASEKIDEFWITAQKTFMGCSGVFLHSVNWGDENILSKDGVHLNKQGIHKLESFLKNVRQPRRTQFAGRSVPTQYDFISQFFSEKLQKIKISEKPQKPACEKPEKPVKPQKPVKAQSCKTTVSAKTAVYAKPAVSEKTAKPAFSEKPANPPFSKPANPPVVEKSANTKPANFKGQSDFIVLSELIPQQNACLIPKRRARQKQGIDKSPKRMRFNPRTKNIGYVYNSMVYCLDGPTI